VKCSVDKCIIHLLDLPTLIKSRDNRQFLHSWVDLSTVTSVEAQRRIAAYYAAAYRGLSRDLFNPELSWGASRISRLPAKANQSYHQFHIFHYVGLGLRPPDAELLWLTGGPRSSATALADLRDLLSPPCILLFDCDMAAALRPFLEAQQLAAAQEQQRVMCFAFFACSASSRLRIPPGLPLNFFTCVILSPERAFVAATGIRIGKAGAASENFLDLLDLFAESIALDALAPDVFYRLSGGTRSLRLSRGGSFSPSASWRRLGFALSRSRASPT
jgi:hypothetical protein